MKKWTALLVALMMTALCAVSLAEETGSTVSPEAIALYSSEWTDGFTSVRIFAEEDHWRVWVVSADGTAEWDYCCLYDAAEKTLKADTDLENTKSIITMDEEGSVTANDVVYTDGAAVFSLNGEGKLIWKDEKEDAGAGFAFEKIGWYEGLWVCGEETGSRYELNCYWDVEEPGDGNVYSGYKVEIERYDGEEYTHWVYSCFYDAETNTLSSIFGSKEYAEKEGDAINTVYDDGEAEFSFDDEGCICWKDKVEDAGNGLQFNATNG